MLMLTPMIMKSQNATATLGTIVSCPGQGVLVPINVTGFFEVGAMTFYISYDTTAATFLSLENINPAIPSWISVYANNGQVALAYSSLTPFDLDGEKLLDLSFSYLSDSTDLSFLSGTEIANINLEIIPLDTYPGGINNSIQIIDQPDSVQAYPDNDVMFNITISGTPAFQWQENTGSGWINLQNNSVYSGVTNDTLLIYDVSLDFDGNTYRCVMTADECTVVSDAALLEVAEAYPAASLEFISSCPDNVIYEPLIVEDFFDVIEFTFIITFNINDMSFIDLTNINSLLLPGTLSTVPITSPPGISIHWENAEPVSIASGNLFDLIFEYNTGSQSVSFGPGSIVLNSLLNPVDITLNNGGIEQFSTPIVITQPANDTVTEPSMAEFSVEVLGASNYKWMLSTDNGNSWNDLTEIPPYFNVDSPSLLINPAVYELTGNLYRCRINNTECMVYSEAGVLIVDTLMLIYEPLEDKIVNIFPVPFNHSLYINVDKENLINKINLYNEKGKLIESYYISNDMTNNAATFNLSFLENGLYFIEVMMEIDSREVVETRKILKIN